MRINSSKFIVMVSALLLPGIACAQHVPLIIVAAALSPLLIILFAVILGVLVRSWRTGAAHAGLIVVWVLLFGIASYSVENDYVIWTPMVLYAIHALIIIALMVLNVKRRAGRSGRNV
jgi:intracellular septation protein A